TPMQIKVTTQLNNVSKRIPKPIRSFRIRNSVKTMTNCEPWARVPDSAVPGHAPSRGASKISFPDSSARQVADAKLDSEISSAALVAEGPVAFNNDQPRVPILKVL